MRTRLLVTALLVAASAMWGGACNDDGPLVPNPPAGGTGGVAAGGGGTGGTAGADPVAARGQYLVDHLMVCGECHTPVGADGKPDMTKYLAGSRSYDFKTKDGTVVSVYAENLTSDAVEGVGAWKDEWITGAITKGLDDQMVALWPIMPYPEYAHMTPDDLAAVLAYIRTIPANSNVVAPDSLADPDPPAAKMDDSKVPHTTLDKADPNYESAERGRYLAILACINCHTEEISPGLSDLTKAFAGGRKYKSHSDAGYSTSTNITPDATGIMGWSAQDIADSLKTNTEKTTGRALCSTMPGGEGRMGDLIESDRLDIGNYLSTIPPIKNGPFACDM